MKKYTIRLISGLFISMSVNTTAYSAEMQGLGYLSDSFQYSDATSISGNGAVAAGFSSSAEGLQAFRWTLDGGMQGLGDLGNDDFYNSYAIDLNFDGSVVVGVGQLYNEGYYIRQAFRWTESGGMQGLGYLTDEGGSSARAVNSDGSIVVGSSDNTEGYSEAFRWSSSDGMVGIGDLAGGDFMSSASDVSSDGSIVVGYSVSANGREAFRWDSTNGMVGLSDLSGGDFDSFASSVSGNGEIVVGLSSSSNGTEAFRWTDSNGMQGLGDLPGGDFNSMALDTNLDGSVIVGLGTGSNGEEAFRWSKDKGMQSLGEWLASNGYALTGWSDTIAKGVSDDGNVIIGSGTFSDGYSAFIASKYGLIGSNSFSASLRNAGNISTQSVTNTQTIMHGSHGHSSVNRAIDTKRTMWISGDLAHDEHHDSDDDFGQAGFGLSYRLTNALSVNASLGKTWGDSDLLFEGGSDSNGNYIVIGANMHLHDELPLYASLSYLYGHNDLSIKRGYLNAGNIDASSGDTSQTNQALSARLQWQSAWQFGLSNVHPYIEYNLVQVKTDGYIETGGGFPVIYNNTREMVRDWRLGTDINYDLDVNTRFIGSIEAVHRNDASSEGISGRLIGLSDFNIAGYDYDRNWLRATAGIERELGKGRLSLTLNTSTEGEDPSYWGGVNYSIAF